ncbi:hypothetical protein B0919_03820 [Hymenobacter sp. CRA2]|nr:hypothetical protein B0919_03820 [Hymenobacter sp. CRA2]
MELVANAWDAGASQVIITWPEKDGDKFAVQDNGHGMTENQFMTRFQMLSYDRAKYQGLHAEIPFDNNIEGSRTVFGKNGKGRFSGFAFGKDYFVRTWRDGYENVFRVFLKNGGNLRFKKIGDATPRAGHGTEIYVEHAQQAILSEALVRSEIGMRFLVDPKFEVFLNSVQIDFSDIPKDNVEEILLDVEGVGQVKITIIDVKATDKTTHQHGVAWLVNKRMVGECSWKGTGYEYLLDGRKVAAKRYTFIVEADALANHYAILPDWTAFNPVVPEYKKVLDAVNNTIKGYLIDLTKESREEVFKDIKKQNIQELKLMGLVSRQKWEEFVKDIADSQTM